MQLFSVEIFKHLYSFEIKHKGIGPEKDRFSYQNKMFNFSIKPGDKVLDIGSGGYPFPQATHLADYYEGDTTHRTEKLVTDVRPFTCCDIENTPFADKEFDFVYCSHLLEHVSDPKKACKEIMRIGKRGYIETPTRMSDILFNFISLANHHKWHTHVLGNTLIFMEWSDNERRNCGSNYFFDQFQSEWDNEIQQFIHKNRDMFVCMLSWENTFDCIIIDKNGNVQ